LNQETRVGHQGGVGLERVTPPIPGSRTRGLGVPVRADGPRMHVVAEAILTYLGRQPRYRALATEVQDAVPTLVGHAVNPVNIRELRLQLGIEQHYDHSNKGKSTWALPQHLWPEVTDTDRELAAALLEAAGAEDPDKFAQLWDERADIRGWQTGMALAQLALTSNS
jgi:hypothetical protein